MRRTLYKRGMAKSTALIKAKQLLQPMLWMNNDETACACKVALFYTQFVQ
jgi:hypothetical protein